MGEMDDDRYGADDEAEMRVGGRGNYLGSCSNVDGIELRIRKK